ncbi:VRR-NUC domain-containing protein [Oceanospirillum sanctuarii]|uniref:VRR-NUC domain-containing protein n=1 Tax=Oceanospirillum sanctuarii TaxID=1434821 RepID=UPI000A38B0D5|nr:VRR-NUC domain-containing protein [Oceanospirillum sanctuarii]
MTTDSSGSFIPTPSSLDDPFYYLVNARQVIDWCLLHYKDLLLTDETALLEQFLQLPEQAQGLLIRLIMRKGDWFRDDSLNYPEVGDAEGFNNVLRLLEDNGFVSLTPTVSLPELTRLCRKPEALALLKHCHQGSDQALPPPMAKHSKQELLLLAEGLSANLSEKHQLQEITHWWPDAPFLLIALRCSPLFERLRLMFFGNLYQSWSEFVLTELGIQQYERVDFTPESRAFKQRQEVDIYLALYQIQQQLDVIKTNAEALAFESDPLEDLAHSLDKLVAEHQAYLSDEGANRSEWLQRRYHKICFQLGHHAERSGYPELALKCYRNSQEDEAVIRRFRLMEKLVAGEGGYEALYNELEAVLLSTGKPEQRLLLKRILKRVARKLNKSVKSSKKVRLTEKHLIMQPYPNRSVEPVLVDHLAEQGEIAFHVESRLINGLFSLLFWPALFEPVPGAFFNPFQSGPADLYREDFYQDRQQRMDEIFHRLTHSDDYKEDILSCYQQKQGISCTLMHWPVLNETLIKLSLELIPAKHLEALFRHLLLDLRHHRKGLPDLVVFNPDEKTYRFVEVKAPGDRLQDHQRLWLEQMLRDGIPAEVVYVSWQDY